MDELNQQALEQALTTQWLGRSVHYYPEVGSTNEVLAQLADANAPAGTLVIAEFQSSGRGRLHRRWEAPPGTSLLFSLLFRPDWPLEHANWITMLAGLASVDAIRAQCDVHAGLKWPNDVMIETADGWRKTGGLLANSVLAEGKLAYVIMGIGLNVNIPQAHMPATNAPAASLLQVIGTPIPRLPLLVTLLNRLEAGYEAATAGQSPQPSWNRQLMMLGTRVRISGPNLSLEGIAEATDEAGQLLVRDDHGVSHNVRAGDVTLRTS